MVVGPFLSWILLHQLVAGAFSHLRPDAASALLGTASSLTLRGPIVTKPRTLPKGLTPKEPAKEPTKVETPEPEKEEYEELKPEHHEPEVAAAIESEEGSHPSEAEEAEEAPSAESLAIAYFLMSSVGALMVVFHFANSSYGNIKSTTWRVLNMTVSIFAAVLLYGTLKNFIRHVFVVERSAMPAITLSLFGIFFVGSHAILFKLKRKDEELLQAAATILSHLCGFAAMYGFAECQEVPIIEEYGAEGILFPIILAVIVIVGLSYIMDHVMDRIAKSDGTLSASEVHWIECCEETDDDVLCLAVSFLVVLFFRSWIRGSPQPYEPGLIGNVNQSDSNRLLACSFVFALMMVLGIKIMSGYQSKLDANPGARRITTILQHLNSMIVAWSLLFWAEWQLYVWGWERTVIGASVTIAVSLTMFSFLCVVLLNITSGRFRGSKVLQRALKSLELSLGILIGFSWERAFDVGFEQIELHMEMTMGHKHTWAHHATASLLVSTMSIGLFAIVGPAWRYHILPKALQLQDKDTPASGSAIRALDK